MKSIIVTGANRGIGLATCLSLARAGHRVFATMRNPNGANELKKTVESESLAVSVSAMDVNSDNSVRDAIGRILEEQGGVDVLVNNAGIERRGTVEELDLAEFRAVMETNYFGAIRCMQAVLPTMRRQGHGCIVNVSSVSGHIASSPLGPYCASKFALEAISEALGQEVKAFGIRVAIIEPGIIDTDMARGVTREPKKSLYPHGHRFAGLFSASLKSPTGPEVVASKILEVIEDDSAGLRHPAGPDALPFLEWRAGMTDEEWIDWGAADDATWYSFVESDFGLDARVDKSQE